MTIWFAVCMGVLQALTEFLPVSSSGHLAVGQIFFYDFGLAEATPLVFNVLIHLATLLVTLIFLREDIWRLCSSLSAQGEDGKRARTLVILLFLGSLPAAFIGLGFKDLIEASFSSALVVGCGFLITAALLELCHRRRFRIEKVAGLSGADWPLPAVTQAIIIGVAQAVAITPGISRSGSTICIALLLGLPVSSAVRFSFLLSLPAIGGAALLEGRKLETLPASDFLPYLLGFLTTVVVGWFAINMLIKFVQAGRFRVFSIYTAGLGAFMLLYFMIR